MQTNLSFNLSFPTQVLFGQGQLNNLSTLKMPGKKALLVISNGKSTKVNGYLDRTVAQLQIANVDYVLFDKVEPNPLKSTVEEGAKVARENNCDFIVALGGGSVMDCAKGIALNATNPGDLWDYIMAGTGKRKRAENEPLPIIAITTTAGTGSEVDSGGVITNPQTKEKTAIFHPHLYPVIAIVDPDLMRTVPPKFTAYQGFDALFHSTEGILHKRATLMSDLVSSAAIKNIAGYLARACKDGNDMEARAHVAFANTMSGYSMCLAGCTAEHSLEHALSAYHQELPHGAGLIMISVAYYTKVINKHACDDRLIKMADWMGKKDAKDPMDFVVALKELQKACGVDDLKMSDYGITPDEFEAMADNAFSAMGFLFDCERAPLSRQDCIDIFRASYR